MSDDTETIVDPALTVGDPLPAGPPQPEPVDPPEPQPRMISADVLVREVTPLRARQRELEQAIADRDKRLRDADELISRLQRPTDPNAPPAPAQPRQTDARFTQDDVERAAVELNFKRDANTVSETAFKTYGQRWVDSLGILNSFGLNSGDFVGSVMEVAGVGKTHEVMHEIAQNPEQAAQLAGMSAARRIAEITRISEKMNAKPAAGTQTQPAATQQPPARTVSRAPAPAPRVDPSASQTVDWRSDKATDDDFSRGWEENMAKRRARR